MSDTRPTFIPVAERLHVADVPFMPLNTIPAHTGLPLAIYAPHLGLPHWVAANDAGEPPEAA